VTCELTSVRCEPTLERRDVTSVAWRVPLNRRRVSIAAVEVISGHYGVPARREETPGDQSAMADERRWAPAIGDDVAVAHQSVNAVRCSAPRNRGDASAASEGVVTARSDVSPTRCE
jgi:hypothetical protein